MKRTFELTIFLVATICLFSSNTNADVVLTFEQSGVVDGSALDPAYGDRVVESPDVNGHVYDIVIGSLLGSTTPNVEVDYVGTGEPRIWTAGYGDLPFVLFDDLDFENGFSVEFTADAGYEVGIVGFDLAAFGSDQAIPGVEIVNGSGTSLWSASSPTVSGSTRTSFSTGGVFGSSLTINLDLTGLGGNSDNIGIANIQFGQVAVPEPGGAGMLLLGIFGLLARRKRSMIR